MVVTSEDEDSGTDRKTDNAVMEPHCVEIRTRCSLLKQLWLGQ